MNHRCYRIVPGILAGVVLSATIASAQFQRIAIMEEFTSVTCFPCTTATAYLNQLVAQYGDRFVTIRTQLNIPSPHTYWTTEGKARGDHYNITGIPAAALDGVPVFPQNPDVVTKVEDRFNVTSPIQIGVTQTREGTKMNVQVTLTSADSGLAPNHAIHVVAVQRRFHDEAILQVPHNNGEEFLDDMMRSFVNGVDGEPVTLASNKTKTLDFSYDIDPGWNPDELYTVVFVQDQFTDVVAQAGFSPRPASSVDRESYPPGFSIDSPIPSPAMSRTTLHFRIGSPLDVAIEIYAIDGTLLRRQELGRLDAGAHSAELHFGNVASGIYSCLVKAGEVQMVRRVAVSR